MVKIIAVHVFMLFPDKILIDHHILVPVADLPFSWASFSIKNFPSTAGIYETVIISGCLTPYLCIYEKTYSDILCPESLQ